jgi:hypothetical protein
VKPSHAPNDNVKDQLIGRTRQVWQPRLGGDLSREDARQMVENVTGFFALLAKWSRAEPSVPANDTGKPTAFEAEKVPHDH